MTLNCISSARGWQCVAVLCGDHDKESVIFLKGSLCVCVCVMLFCFSFIMRKEKKSSVIVSIKDFKSV